jgi:CRP/FNR family transcriptional regulator, cyclic AMP receptor protein
VRKGADQNDSCDQSSTESLSPGFFSVLEAETRKAFFRSCHKMTLQTGESLFIQESEHSRTFIIQSGVIRTFYVSETGREVTLGYWSSGDIVGGPNIFGGGRHVWSAVANRRAEVLAISGADLKKIADADFKVMNWIVKVLEFKLRWLSILFQIHGTERVQNRLAKLLLMMGDLYGDELDGGIIIKLQISQADLATLVGASRQWTNKALANLRHDGAISMQGRHIVLRDPMALRTILSED